MGDRGHQKNLQQPERRRTDPHLAITPDGSMAMMWGDFNDLYVTRSDGTTWVTPILLAKESGVASLNLIYDPVSGTIHMAAAARKQGYTYSDSWDVLYCTE